jgi:hypothetical protein
MLVLGRGRDEVAGGHREAFDAVLADVERAKAALVAAVPAGRAPGTPLADAVLGFEESLRRAMDRMPGWHRDVVDDVWRECDRALRTVLAGAEWLRLEAPPLDHEGLVMTLGRLLDPLEAFEDADRALGV